MTCNGENIYTWYNTLIPAYRTTPVSIGLLLDGAYNLCSNTKIQFLVHHTERLSGNQCLSIKGFHSKPAFQQRFHLEVRRLPEFRSRDNVTDALFESALLTFLILTRMSNARPPFSMPLFGLFQALIVLGYTLRPSWYRPLLFIPIAAISCYLILHTDAGFAGSGIGGAIATHMLFAFDGIVVKDVQQTLHRVGEKPGQILTAPFLERLVWGWHLHNSPRGVRWAHESSHIPTYSATLSTREQKKAFVTSRIFVVVFSVTLQLVFFIINGANAALTPGAPRLVDQSVYVRAMSLVGLAISAHACINALHCMASIILVAAGISEPGDWPPLFGCLTNMYSVQNFWR